MSFNEYVAHLKGPAAHLTRALWLALNKSAPGLAEPQCGPLPDDDGFQLVWDRDEHHLEIDVYADESVEAFYRNRDTEVEGALNVSDLKDRLALFTGAEPR